MQTASATRSSTSVETGDSASYRSYLTFDADSDAPGLALQQVSSWFREKGYGEVDLSESRFERLGERAELVVAHGENRRGHSLRVRLAETDPRGKQWLTSIAMHAPHRGAGWLSLRVGHTGGKPAETPKIARYLMEVLDLRDSDYRVVAGAPIIRPDGVDELLEAICDTDRNGLLFVAATDTEQVDLFAPFVERVEHWARRVHGIAQFVVLDPAATLAFNEGIGATHAATPWAIRTYAPGADPAWEPDARRHRILGTRRLASEDDRTISNIVVRAARKHSSDHKLPEQARAVIKDLNRIEDRLLLDSLFAPSDSQRVADRVVADLLPTVTVEEAAEQIVVEAEEVLAETAAGDNTAFDALADTNSHPAETDTDLGSETPEALDDLVDAVDQAISDVAPAVSEYLATIEMVKQALGVEDLRAETLRQIADAASRVSEQAAAREAITNRVSRELAERQERIETLEDRLTEARVAADDATIEQRIAEDARRSAEDQARWLRRIFDEQGRHDEAWATMPDAEITKVPDDFEELLDRVGALEEQGVVFTGDRRITLGLDDQDTMGNIVASAWECLLVLADYVAAKRAGDYAGNVKTYLKQTPSGYRTVPQTRFGEAETESTLNQWGRQRIFKVPTDVHEDCEVLMEAHFKLPRCGMVTPRIHYYDHTHASGMVYVGYIGPHLRTKATN